MPNFSPKPLTSVKNIARVLTLMVGFAAILGTAPAALAHEGEPLPEPPASVLTPAPAEYGDAGARGSDSGVFLALAAAGGLVAVIAAGAGFYALRKKDQDSEQAPSENVE